MSLGKSVSKEINAGCKNGPVSRNVDSGPKDILSSGVIDDNVARNYKCKVGCLDVDDSELIQPPGCKDVLFSNKENVRKKSS